MYVINFIRGFFMALADSVPGVSGGTIAFIMGFYDDFISSLNSLSSKDDLDNKKKSMIFLFKIGIGWIFGMVLSVLFLSTIFEEQIYNISSLFIGFIIFSIPIITREEKESLTSNYKNMVFALLGIFIVTFITYFNPSSSGEGINLAIENLSIGTAVFVFFAAMIAISAMVLPGISGSTLLLIFGLYAGVIKAIKEFITFNFSYLPILIIFGLGIIAGILSTIRIIKFLLKKYRSAMIYFIVGLMIGSLYAVFMGPTTLETPKPAMTLNTFSFLFFFIGGALIVGLEKGKDLLEKSKVN